MIYTYTASCGSLDPVRTDVRCFTSKDYDLFKDPRRNARAIKILSHLFVPEAEFTVWIDANIQLLVRPETLVEMMGDADVALFRHWERNDIYEEAEAVLKIGKDIPANVLPQIERYRQAGFTREDLGMTFILVRRQTAEVNRLNEMWWAELCRYSLRDQLSFPFVFQRVAKYWPEVPLSKSDYFIRHRHGHKFCQ